MWTGTKPRIGDRSRLGRLDTEFTAEGTFAVAESLRIRLRGVMVTENKDRRLFRGENDLMILTTYSFGDDPLVDRIHLVERDAESGWWGDFFDEVIVSKRDLSDENLTLRIRVYDLDGVGEEVLDSVRDFSTTAAVTFPVLAPYAGLVGLGVVPLIQLVDRLDAHDEIIDERLTLEMREPGTGHQLLQRGYFVCFSRPTVPEGLSLRNDLRVETDDGEAYRAGSYAVVEVDDRYEPQREREVDQKAAKLAAQLNGKGRSINPALVFLRDTLDTYATFSKLERVRELGSKDDRTPAEEALFEELRAELIDDDTARPYVRLEE